LPYLQTEPETMLKDCTHPARFIHFRVIFFKVILCTLIFTGCNGGPDPDGSHTGGSWADALRTGEARITALYVPADGFAMQSGDSLTGVTVDILREFALWVHETHAVTLHLDFTPEQNFSTFMQNVTDAGEGMIGFANVTITAQRGEMMDFSPPYMSNIAVLITHSDRSELERFAAMPAAFSGLTALAFEGTLHEDRLKKLIADHYPEMPVTYEQSNAAIIERTASADNYLAYVDVYNYWRAAASGAPLRRHAIGDDAAEQFGYILPRGSSFTPVLHEFFESDGGFTRSETYGNILRTHLGDGLANLLIEQMHR
jgi:ABC-type amino acid transport substrate-binding protein